MSIAAAARSRGITRLIHFSPAQNVAQMLDSGTIEGTEQLTNRGAAFKQNDHNRLDGGIGDVCCTIEYPNTWYLDRVRSEDPNFLDWIILALDINLLDREGVGFFPYNAARGRGAGRREGAAGFGELFSSTVQGQQTFTRLPNHPAWWPTDDQAEVQIPGPIGLGSVRSVIFRDGAQLGREKARYGMLRPMHPLPPAIVAPTLFDKRALSSSVRRGVRPAERPIP